MADFKPLKIGDTRMTTAQADRVKAINKAWTNDPVVKNFHEYWKEWIKWFEGDQYTLVNKETGKLEDITPYVERETKNVYNRILPIIRQQWGELRYDHQFYLEPNTLEREDIRAAKIGSMLVEWTNYNGKFKRKINLAKLYALIMGNVFWKEFWNRNLVGYVSKDNGKTLAEVKGDVDYDMVNAFNCRPDPKGTSRNAWRWFTEGKSLPVELIAEEFGIEKRDIPSETKSDNVGTGLFERENIEESDEPTAIRKEYYERPTKDHPKGRMLVIVGQWLMYEDDNPNPKQQIPYFHFKGILPMIDQLWGDSSVRIGQDAQRQFNRLCSMVDEKLEHYDVKAMIPFGSLRDGDLRAFKRGGVDYVVYNPRIGTPYYQNPPGISGDMISWISRQENEIETQMSVRKVSLGELPKYASRASGVLFQGLKQQDEVVLLPTIEDWDGVLEDVMRFRLELIEQHYTLPRIVKIFGKKVETSIAFFKGADLHGNTDVRVKPGVDIFTNKMMKREIVGMLIEKGVIQDPKEAFELMQTGGIEEYLEDQFIDRKQHSRHLEIMKTKGIYIAAQPDDNHEVGFEVFNNFRKTSEYEEMDEKKQKLITKRMAEHKMFKEPEEEAAPGGGDEAAILAEKQAELGGMPPVPAMEGGGGMPIATVPPRMPPEIAAVVEQIRSLQGGQ